MAEEIKKEEILDKDELDSVAGGAWPTQDPNIGRLYDETQVPQSRSLPPRPNNR